MTTTHDSQNPKDPEDAIDRNVSAIHELRIRADEDRSPTQKLVDDVATFFGSTSSLLFHLSIYGALLLVSTFVYFKFIDDSTVVNFTFIECVATIEAIFLAVFVLINQRRMNAITRRHSDLQLQIALLSEHELGTIAHALSLIGEKVSIDQSAIRELRKLSRDIHPHDIVDAIKTHEQARPTDLTESGLDQTT